MKPQFSKKQVFFILASKLSRAELSKKFEVSLATIDAIRVGRNYVKEYNEFSKSHPELKMKPPAFVKTDRLMNLFASMRHRCTNKNSQVYERYGGRGISVCKEWAKFSEFKKWALASGYAENLTIDRIDNNGNYSPDNCRWITHREQQRNKRSNRYLTINGETMLVADWVKRSSLKASTIRARIWLGWDAHSAVFKPLCPRSRAKNSILNPIK